MITEIVTQHEQIVKWATPIDDTTDLTDVPDGVYPYAGDSDGDQWVVVTNQRQTIWARYYGDICLLYIEALRVNRKHVKRNPAEVNYV